MQVVIGLDDSGDQAKVRVKVGNTYIFYSLMTDDKGTLQITKDKGGVLTARKEYDGEVLLVSVDEKATTKLREKRAREPQNEFVSLPIPR